MEKVVDALPYIRQNDMLMSRCKMKREVAQNEGSSKIRMTMMVLIPSVIDCRWKITSLWMVPIQPKQLVWGYLFILFQVELCKTGGQVSTGQS